MDVTLTGSTRQVTDIEKCPVKFYDRFTLSCSNIYQIGMLTWRHVVFLMSALSANQLCFETVKIPVLNGRYTKSIESYHLSVPQKITENGVFQSFHIPTFYNHDFSAKRGKRIADDPDIIHFRLHVNDTVYHVEIWPNHGFVSPNAAFEKREPSSVVNDRKLRTLDREHMCHYVGVIRGYPNSKVALSTCDGLSGYLQVQGKRYYIEPVDEHVPNDHGQHLHVVYERSSGQTQTRRCGTEGTWENAWRDRFREKYMKEEQLERGKRGFTSVHRYLETLVVCDKKFLAHYKNKDYETYVLTIMNMVADYYHDSSGGNQMDVVVVRVIYLEKEEEEIDLVINQNADDTLASFCKWQERVNPKELSNPNHHDIAVLFTRHDICANNLTECGLMGLAFVAGACTGNQPCAINEDGGLVLGIVVAHEMGHVMGCAHDAEGESSCSANDNDGSFFVMAPFVHLFTTKWSTCSRAFITALFDNNLGECLNDEPETSLYKFRDMLPGSVYDADQQCDMEFPGSTKCVVNEETFCEMLMCKVSPTECMSNEEPPADGTKCGENMWCYRKKCIEIGQRPEAINGGWGEWGEFSGCSRTCGGGVAIAERECDNPPPEHKGRYCMGERKQVKLCNMQPCPAGSPSFRDVQCAEENPKPFNERMYTWKAYMVKDEPCVLYCINNEYVFAKLQPRAKDGTRCKPGTKDICIGGKCTRIGCDNVINSDAVEDICGICKGDGTRCKINENIYDDPPGVGYQRVTLVPAGSRNIEFQEMAPSVNTMAVSASDEKTFFLNGAHVEESDGDKEIAKTDGLYSHPEPGKEFLFIKGPIAADIVLLVCFFSNENVGYKYKYAEQSMESFDTSASYHWEMLDWTDCNVRCGGGEQTAKLSCVEENSGRVSETFCNDVEKPEQMSKKCNEQPCKTKWRIGKWGKCHACKFKSGIRMREVECVRESPIPGTEDILVEDIECKGVKPGTRELCNSHRKCKSRRQSIDFPEHMMRNIWKQSYAHISTTRDNLQDSQNSDEMKDIDERPCSSENGEQRYDTQEFSRLDEDNKEKELRFPKSTKYKGASKEPNQKVDQFQSKCDTEHKNDNNISEPPTIKLKVGSIVVDHEPNEEIKLLKVPIKKTSIGLNLTDIGIESLGDKLSDSIDMANAKEFKGQEAAEEIKKAEEKNANTHYSTS